MEHISFEQGAPGRAIASRLEEPDAATSVRALYAEVQVQVGARVLPCEHEFTGRRRRSDLAGAGDEPCELLAQQEPELVERCLTPRAELAD